MGASLLPESSIALQSLSFQFKLGNLGGDGLNLIVCNIAKVKEPLRSSSIRHFMAAKLSVGPVQTGAKPTRTLGKHGTTLWRAIMSEYQIEDSGGVEMLTAACQCLDRAESLREQIDSDGDIIRTKAGMREHPGLKHELAARAFVIRTLARLGLDSEAIKPIGRPPAKSWGGD